VVGAPPAERDRHDAGSQPVAETNFEHEPCPVVPDLDQITLGHATRSSIDGIHLDERAILAGPVFRQVRVAAVEESGVVFRGEKRQRIRIIDVELRPGTNTARRPTAAVALRSGEAGRQARVRKKMAPFSWCSAPINVRMNAGRVDP
jgi:hypothetical protein